MPPPKLFAYINPVQINLDPITVLWLNAFALNLEKSVKAMSLEKGEPPYLDVKIEAIMFKVGLAYSISMLVLLTLIGFGRITAPYALLLIESERTVPRWITWLATIASHYCMLA